MGYYKDKWHIGLNSKGTAEGSKVGYLVERRGYRCQRQMPKPPAFEPGDRPVQELTTLRYLSQQDFTGGQGQTIFQDTTRFHSSENINVLSARGLDDKPLVAGFKLAPAVEQATTLTSGIWKMKQWGGKIWLVELTSGAVKTFDGSSLVSIETISGGAKSIESGFYWYYDGNYDHRCAALSIMASGGLVYQYDIGGTKIGAFDYILSTYNAGYYFITFNSAMYVFYQDDESTEPGIKVEKHREHYTQNGRGHAVLAGTKVAACAVAGDPLELYIVTVDETAEKSYVYVTDGSTLSYDDEPPWLAMNLILQLDGRIEAMREWRNTLVLGGYRTNSSGGKTGFIYTYPYNLIHETDADSTDRSVNAIHTDDVVLCGRNEKTGLFQFDPLGFSSGSLQGSTGSVVYDILKYKGQTYFCTANRLYRLSDTDYAATGWLQSSYYDAGQPLLKKICVKVIVSIKEALVSGEQVVLKARRYDADSWQTIFTWTSGGSETINEATFPYDYASEKVQLRFELTRSTAGTHTPEIEQVTLGYMPGTPKQSAWALSLKIGPDMKLLDGTKESRTAEEMRDGLETLARTDEILELVDFDGTAYDVWLEHYEADAPVPVEETGYVALVGLQEMPS